MAHYVGPKSRVNRRLGCLVFENAGAVRAWNRRPSPPGMAAPQRKLSKYGEAMREKQKIKYYYGLGERQLRRLFDRARRQPGNAGQNLLLLCERRIDNVIWRASLAKTRPQARQGVAHGHIALNGRLCRVPSATLAVGDVVSVKRRRPLLDLYAGWVAAQERQAPDWLVVNLATLSATVVRLPVAADITLPVNVAMVVELLAR